jgi:hypothetical protein
VERRCISAEMGRGNFHAPRPCQTGEAFGRRLPLDEAQELPAAPVASRASRIQWRRLGDRYHTQLDRTHLDNSQPPRR